MRAQAGRSSRGIGAATRRRRGVSCRAMAWFDRLRPRYDGALVATVGGIVDRVKNSSVELDLDARDRIDATTCLVTGANRGLGLAIAKELARRGGDVILACRSGVEQARDAVAAVAHERATVQARELDLASLASIEALCERLTADGVRLDVVVLNAGVVPREARRTTDGLDEAFQVNFLANVLLVARLRERGLLAAVDGVLPRIVAVSSESHRSAPPLDWLGFGEFRPWSMREAVKQYGYGKLLLQTWVAELTRRTEGELAVHSLCPGAVRSDIAREAPPYAKPLLDLTMRAFFVEPDRAAAPAVYLAASRRLEHETGIYLHGKRRRDPRADTLEPENGRRIWERSEQLLRELGHPLEPTKDR